MSKWSDIKMYDLSIPMESAHHRGQLMNHCR